MTMQNKMSIFELRHTAKTTNYILKITTLNSFECNLLSRSVRLIERRVNISTVTIEVRMK